MRLALAFKPGTGTVCLIINDIIAEIIPNNFTAIQRNLPKLQNNELSKITVPTTESPLVIERSDLGNVVFSMDHNRAEVTPEAIRKLQTKII